MLNIIAGTLSTGVAPVTGSYESIATVSVGSGGSSSISFTSIPATFTHLQIRGITRGTRANINTNVYFGFNSDTTTGNYYGHGLYGTGSAAGALAKIGSATNALIASIAATGAASSFSGFVIDVLDYANTNKYKTIRVLTGVDNNGDGVIGFSSGNWRNTAAITSVTIGAQVGNWVAYSSFALYGIK